MIPCGFSSFIHELLAILLTNGNHELIDAHWRVLKLALHGNGHTMATFRPKKFLISPSLTAFGQWSDITWCKPTLQSHPIASNTLYAHRAGNEDRKLEASSCWWRWWRERDRIKWSTWHKLIDRCVTAVRLTINKLPLNTLKSSSSPEIETQCLQRQCLSSILCRPYTILQSLRNKQLAIRICTKSSLICIMHLHRTLFGLLEESTWLYIPQMNQIDRRASI